MGQLYRLFLKNGVKTAIVIIPEWSEAQLLLNLRKMMLQYSYNQYKDTEYPISLCNSNNMHLISTEQRIQQTTISSITKTGSVYIKQERLTPE